MVKKEGSTSGHASVQKDAQRSLFGGHVGQGEKKMQTGKVVWWKIQVGFTGLKPGHQGAWAEQAAHGFDCMKNGAPPPELRGAKTQN